MGAVKSLMQDLLEAKLQLEMAKQSPLVCKECDLDMGDDWTAEEHLTLHIDKAQKLLSEALGQLGAEKDYAEYKKDGGI